MPVSRTRGGPVAERQQCFRSTVLRLKALAKIDSLQGFATAVFWADQISSIIAAVADACTVDDGEDAGSYNKLLEAFYFAISNGQKQLVLNWPQSTSHAVRQATSDSIFLDAVVTVGLLSKALCGCRHLEWYQQEHERRELDSAIEAGFLQNFTSLVSKLLPALQGTADQRAASIPERHGHLTAVCLLNLWCYIFECWPGCKLTDSSLTATLGPAARLAFALMRVIPADVAPANSDNSSKTSSTSEACLNVTLHYNEDKRIIPCVENVSFAYCLFGAVHNQCCVAPNCSNSQSTLSSSAAAALASTDVQQLLFFGLAATAAVMHRQHAAGSTVGPPAAAAAAKASHTLQQGQRQQQHAEYGYKQLLVALEIPDADELLHPVLQQRWPHNEEALKDPEYHKCMFRVVCYLYESLNHGSSSASGNNTATSIQLSPDAQALLQQLALPVLHTLKDFALLMSDDDWEGIGVIICAFGSVARPLMQRNCLGPEELQQILQWLLQPLYQKMCKALCTFSQQTAGSSRLAGLEGKLTETWASAIRMFLTLSRMFHGWKARLFPLSCHLQPSSTGINCLSSSCEQVQPQHCCILLCPMKVLAFRACLLTHSIYALLWTTCMTEPDPSATAGSSLQDCLLAAIKQDPVTSLAAVEAFARIGNACLKSKQQPVVHLMFRFAMLVLKRLTRDDAKDMVAHLAVKHQLLSLTLCQAKLLMLTAAAPQATNAGNVDSPAFGILCAQLQDFACVFNLLMSVDNKLTDGQQPQPSVVTEAVQCYQLTVMGKAMFASAVSLLNHMPGPQLMISSSMQVWINHASALVLLAGDHGKAALAAAKVHELLKQLQESSRAWSVGSTEIEDDEESSRSLLQLMQQCGAAVCAALPAKFCCNNPACLNLAKMSERQLVAGKGSRCSSCKVARYCSRECQLKHWKQHKQACKRIQAEAIVAEGGS